MAKPDIRPYSRYAREAAKLLGSTIRDTRIQRKVTVAELAERVGISRGLVQRIEKGAMECSIGAVFELAAILGIALFDAEPATLNRYLGAAHEKLTLLPERVRRSTRPMKDDF
ncbi:MAG: helix-turn-helix transcriptional regulator [Pseudomonadota bacterium]